ncbi:hypothetical protein AB0H00_12410 [Nocardia sp. NPDC023852]|uniref:hypothetical protein n=1 Tax=unclassified Nocardia TaxID=2637762 RepID=UPI0033FFC0C2|nr:hypothetical protein OH799_04165 [Nocardia sp. NBC_00881]
MGYEWWYGAYAVLAMAGIERHEVIEVLYAERRWPRRGIDPVTGLWALTIWARTDAGRPLIVTLRALDGFDRQIVAVQQMTPDQLQEFSKWEKTR